MGNGCSVFQINKFCLNGDLNIVSDKNDPQSKNDNINIIAIRNKKNSHKSLVKKQITLNSNGIKYKTEQEQQKQDLNNSISSPINAIQSRENSKIDSNIQNNPKSNFTNFMQDLDFSFTNNNGHAQNDVFDINYIKIKSEYNEEILDYLNKIRTEPNNIISDIDNLLEKSKSNTNNKMQLESEETHENIILDDGGKALKETKDYLNAVIPLNLKFDLNDELLIDISDSEKNMDLAIDKKITKILVEKRKNIIDKYPNCQFFINFIKDTKMGLLFLLSQNENMSNFRNIMFDPKFTQFNVTWIKEKKKIFIAFLCFA